MNTRTLSLTVVSGLCAGVSAPVAAQSFTNGTFNTSLSGWTVVNTSNGVGAPGNVASIDIDGPGPLILSNAARFAAGQAAFQSGVPHGVELTQNLSLVAGKTYVVDFDWSTQKLSGTGAADPGRFSLIVGGAIITQAIAGTTSPTSPQYGHVTGSFTSSVSGPVSVGIRITRPFTPAADLFQFVDNVTIVAAPAATALGALPVGLTTATGTLAPGEVRWFSFTIPAIAAPMYLDIDTEGTVLSPSNDTILGLFKATGELVVIDDDDGSGFLSQLTFGNPSPRPGVGSGLVYNGRDGALAAGTYFLAISGFGATFGPTPFGVTSSSINTGPFQLRLTRGNDVVTGGCCAPSSTCSITTQVACISALGVYRGDGTDCAAANCPTVLFDAGRACPITLNGSQTVTGFSSGSLPGQGLPQRWTAQAFSLPQASRIRILSVTGFVPVGSEFTTMNYVVWRRNGTSRPVEGDQVATGSMPLPASAPDPRLPNFSFPLFRLPVDFNLTAGDYYMTVFASGAVNSGGDANFAWLANAQQDPAHPGAPNTPIVVSDAQGAFMWRSGTMPSPGFERFTTTSLSAALNPPYGPDPQNPDYLYNTSFTILGDVLLNTCYANCDNSTGSPLLTANDFQCFLNQFAAQAPYANCDASTGNPALTANDFQCFLDKFAAGCP